MLPFPRSINSKCNPCLAFIHRSRPGSQSPRHISRWSLTHGFPDVPLLSSPLTFQAPTLRCPKHSPRLSYIDPIYPRLQLHIRTFSHSPARHIRNIYFPKSPGGGSHKNDGPFVRLKSAINTLPSSVILWTVLGLNGAVYLVWNVGIDRAQNHRDPTIITALLNNFTLSWQNWKEGRFWTVLTSCFSNQATSHIFMNALTFYWMAPPVLQILGNASFLVLYLGGGIASSLFTLYCNEMLLKQPRVVHGASGAIYAVISFMACVAPKATFLIFGIIPLPAWGCVAGLFTWDLLNAISQRQTGVSEISHISGILSGIVYFLHKTGRLPKFF